MKVVIDIPEIPTNDKQRWVLSHGTPYEERPHGEWKHDQFGDFFKSVLCSNCDFRSALEFPFCPSCGAPMRKEGDAE